MHTCTYTCKHTHTYTHTSVYQLKFNSNSNNCVLLRSKIFSRRIILLLALFRTVGMWWWKYQCCQFFLNYLRGYHTSVYHTQSSSLCLYIIKKVCRNKWITKISIYMCIYILYIYIHEIYILIKVQGDFS